MTERGPIGLDQLSCFYTEKVDGVVSASNMNTMQTVTLHTARLLLRRFKKDDVDDVLDYRKGEEFARYLNHIPQPFTRADAEKFVQTNMTDPRSRYPTFAIDIKAGLSEL